MENVMEYEFEQDLPVEEALKKIRSYRGKGKAFYIMVGQFSVCQDDPNKGYSVAGSIQVTLKQAIKFIQSAYEASEKVRMNGTVYITTSERCVFIGHSA